MAKNLKLNIKNAQLAEALKLTTPIKKKGVKSTKETAPAASESTPEPAPAIIEEAPKQEVVTPPPPAPVEAPKIIEEPTTASFSNTKAAAPPKSYEEEKQKTSYAPRQDSSYPPRRDQSSYPPREGQSSYQPRRDQSSYPPREGQSSYQPRRDQSSYPPRQGQSTYPPRQGQSSYPPREGQSSYAPRQGQSSYPPRDGQSSYPPRRDQSGYPPRREGFNSPRPPFRPGTTGDFKPDRKHQPPAPTKELPQQQQQHKKPTSHFNAEKDSKSIKKGSENRAFDVRDRQGLRESDDERWRKRKTFKTKQELQEEVIRPKELKIRLPITVKDLAAEMKLKASQLIAKLFMQGVIITLNDYLDDETTVQLLGHEFECEITVDTSEEEKRRVTDKTIKEEIQGTSADGLQLRPPVVAFMGHVDHGKTSLIDAIRKSNIAASEAGAITQHIGAFMCHTSVGLLTILDTPGHEAFSSMRERGADVTDIVVLVVAGDEGIKTQTLEAIKQAKQAGVCLVVAINKCDKPGFNADNVYRQLADQDLLPEAWGGSVITVNCSAVTGEGITSLLEMLALQAEVLELKANPTTRARGSVIESQLHKGLGPVATILVQNGTLRLGDALVFGELYARVKTMHDEQGKELVEAGPSTPVKITGLSGIPEAGSEFIVVKNEKEAREIAEKRVGHKDHLLLQAKRGSLESLLQNKAESSAKKRLNLILKADVQGSLEALKTSLRKLPSEKVELNFISEGVGEVSESDIQFAAGSKATIIGFHTGVESHAESLIKQEKIKIRLHDIIYHAVDDVKAMMLELLDKIPKENELGEAFVKAVFKSSQLGNIAGCQVADGIIKRNCPARLLRNGEVIWKGNLSSLKRVKEDVREVSKGQECGIVLQGFNDVKEEDRIQSYEITYLQQELT